MGSIYEGQAQLPGQREHHVFGLSIQLAHAIGAKFPQALGGAEVRELSGEPESMVFALPKELRLQLVD